MHNAAITDYTVGGAREPRKLLAELEKGIGDRQRGREKRKQARLSGEEAELKPKQPRGKGKGKGKGKGGAEALQPASEREVAYADTEEADRSERERAAALAALRAALHSGDGGDALRVALSRAKRSGSAGPVVEEAEVRLLDEQISAS